MTLGPLLNLSPLRAYLNLRNDFLLNRASIVLIISVSGDFFIWSNFVETFICLVEIQPVPPHLKSFIIRYIGLSVLEPLAMDFS